MEKIIFGLLVVALVLFLLADMAFSGQEKLQTVACGLEHASECPPTDAQLDHTHE